MRVAKLLATVAVAATVLCCASSDQEDPAARWMREVEVLRPEQLGDRLYDVIAELEERVGIVVDDREAARSEAVHKLRYRAAELDADALVLIACAPAQDWEARAAPAIICRGGAIRWVNP
jgi:hypothetical protein